MPNSHSRNLKKLQAQARRLRSQLRPLKVELQALQAELAEWRELTARAEALRKHSRQRML